MSRLTVVIEDQACADLAAIIRHMRDVLVPKDDPEYDARLRDAQFSIEGALRAHGWTPTGAGTWVSRPRRPR